MKATQKKESPYSQPHEVIYRFKKQQLKPTPVIQVAMKDLITANGPVDDTSKDTTSTNKQHTNVELIRAHGKQSVARYR